MEPRAVIAPNECEALDKLIRAAETMEMYADLIGAEARGTKEAALRLRDGYVSADDYLNSDSTAEYDSMARQVDYANDHDIQVVLSGMRDIVRRL